MTGPTNRDEMSLPAPVFVISSGRCGSTHLSRLLGRHPDVLSLSSLFARPGSWNQLAEPVTGAQFWDRLAQPVPLYDAIVRDGQAPPEFGYAYDRGRFPHQRGTPAIMHTTLPQLTDDPDALFAELAADVPHWPTRPAALHYRVLVDRLRRRFGAAVAVECTAGSLGYVAELVAAFPDARFILLHRSGAQTVLAMNRHVINRFDAVVRDALRILGTTTFRDLPPAAQAKAGGIRRHLPVITPPYDLRALSTFPVPLDAFAVPWLRATRAGVAVLERLPAGRSAVMSYEDLSQRPAQVRTALATFLGLPAPGDWLDESVGADPQPAPAMSWRDGQLAALSAACALPLPTPTLC